MVVCFQTTWYQNEINLKFHQRSGKVTGLTIAVKIFLKSWFFDVCDVLHGLFHHSRDIQEPDAVLKKAQTAISLAAFSTQAVLPPFCRASM